MFCCYTEVCKNFAIIRRRCQIIYGNGVAAICKLLRFAVAMVALLEFIDLCCQWVLTSLVTFVVTTVALLWSGYL